METQTWKVNGTWSSTVASTSLNWHSKESFWVFAATDDAITTIDSHFFQQKNYRKSDDDAVFI